MIRRYSRLKRLHTFEERFAYLRLQGSVGKDTFGFDRHINQQFYRSKEWRDIRQFVIVRDEACDLGIEGLEIHSNLHIHHLNPMTPKDIIHGEDWILDPEFLITCTQQTHNAIHYGDENHLPRKHIPRQPGDTALWERTS
jgi:hypothetical protein